MRALSLLLFTSMMMITGSCNKFAVEPLKINRDVLQIVFFSNESDYSKEATYYDALIELKKNYPHEIKNMLVLSPTKGKNIYQAYDIRACPALIVIYNDEIIVRIVGQTSKEEIITPITATFLKSLDQKYETQKEGSQN
jgi:hypothetical protein